MKDLEAITERVSVLKEFIETNLPNHDQKHYDELMDIFDLFDRRLETYINEYNYKKCKGEI